MPVPLVVIPWPVPLALVDTAEVRGWGLINGLEISAESSLTSVEIVKAAMEQGLLLAPAGPKVLRFVPPLVVTEAEITQAVEILRQAIATLV